MHRSTLTALVGAVVVLLAAATQLRAGHAALPHRGITSPTPSEHVDAQAQQYFACPSGTQFQTNGSRARCYKAGATTQIAPSCPPATALQQNRVGNKDMCVAAGGQQSDYVCPPLYPPSVRSGQDMCVKQDPPMITPPSVPVTI